TPRWGGRYGRGSSQLTPPWADSATGPSLGTSATTVAPREVAFSTAAARSGSPASSPETITTSSAPTHAESRAATTRGGTAGPPTDAASAAATAADCRARAERPVTHTFVRGRTPDTGSSTPACTAVGTGRTWAPAVEAWSSAPVGSAARSASTTSRSTGPAVQPGSGTDVREDLVDDRGDDLSGWRL